jgi:hypothetical protein
MPLPYAFPYVCQRLVQHNVEVNRSKEGVAPAPQETCLTRESVPTVGSAISSTIDLNQP